MQEKIARPQFPTRDGMWQPPAILWKQMCAVYGGRLVEIECQNINLWLVKKPGQWKTARGMPRFLNLWFGRASMKLPKASAKPFEPGINREAWDLTPQEVLDLRAKVGIQ